MDLNFEDECADTEKCEVCQAHELASLVQDALNPVLRGYNTHIAVMAMHLVTAKLTVHGHADVDSGQVNRLLESGILNDIGETTLDIACEIISEYLDETNPERN